MRRSCWSSLSAAQQLNDHCHRAGSLTTPPPPSPPQPLLLLLLNATDRFDSDRGAPPRPARCLHPLSPLPTHVMALARAALPTRSAFVFWFIMALQLIFLESDYSL